MNKLQKTAAAILAAVMVMSCFAGCTKPVEHETEPAQAETETETEAETETEPPETEPETEEETETEITLPDSAEKLEDPDSNITGYSDDPDSETEPETESETEPETEEETKEPERIFNYLNGYTTTKELRDRRPVAIMINNIKNSLPQEGICDGDIYYECSAEGGITRIMMLVSDYEKLGTVGSVRSSRDYFVDFLATMTQYTFTQEEAHRHTKR